VTRDSLHVEGELYLRLETVAELYRVRTVWLREAFDQGLLGRGHRAAGGLFIAAVQLDRVATVVKYHVALGLDVDAIAVAILPE
jgi:hypothetical protein